MIIIIDLNYVQASPCIRFNKEGTLLAISTRENGVKILANADAPMITSGSRERETVPTDKSRIASSSKAKVKQNNLEMSVVLNVLSHTTIYCAESSCSCAYHRRCCSKV